MAGGPYNIPRNTKGEGRFFYVFTTKALIGTVICGVIGDLFIYAIILLISLSGARINTGIWMLIGFIIFGFIGFAITSFKIPESNNFEITRKAGGEYIYSILLRYLKFVRRKNRIYTFFTEEKKDGR
ncbi:MAG TPA: hypothetical protein DEP51_06685 [Clostridiales bacterium]|nr:hypothetical protein [Clostridiales bacterium]